MLYYSHNMPKKFLTLLLAVTVMTLASGAIHCGCAMAEVFKPVETAHDAMSDCHGSSSESSGSAQDECCNGCAIEKFAPIAPSYQIASGHSVFFSSQLFLAIAADQLAPAAAKRYHAQDFDPSPHRSQPLYILIQVLRF